MGLLCFFRLFCWSDQDSETPVPNHALVLYTTRSKLRHHLNYLEEKTIFLHSCRTLIQRSLCTWTVTYSQKTINTTATCCVHVLKCDSKISWRVLGSRAL